MRMPPQATTSRTFVVEMRSPESRFSNARCTEPASKVQDCGVWPSDHPVKCTLPEKSAPDSSATRCSAVTLRTRPVRNCSPSGAWISASKSIRGCTACSLVRVNSTRSAVNSKGSSLFGSLPFAVMRVPASGSTTPPLSSDQRKFRPVTVMRSSPMSSAVTPSSAS